MIPFKTVYGRDPPPLLRWIDEVSKVNTMIREWNLILDELKNNLCKTQNRMKKMPTKIEEKCNIMLVKTFSSKCNLNIFAPLLHAQMRNRLHVFTDHMKS